MKRLVAVAGMLAMAACGGGAIRDTDPHLTGPRDMNYDHLIVPGERIGPVALGGSVRAAVSHLGNPDSGHRSTYRGGGYDADEVRYHYDDECIHFTWMDKGFDPVVESGWRGITVTCGKWHTSAGVHVGSSIEDVLATVGSSCTTTGKDGSLTITAQSGAWFHAKNRNARIDRIDVIPWMADFSNTGCNS